MFSRHRSQRFSVGLTAFPGKTHSLTLNQSKHLSAENPIGVCTDVVVKIRFSWGNVVGEAEVWTSSQPVIVGINLTTFLCISTGMLNSQSFVPIHDITGQQERKKITATPLFFSLLRNYKYNKPCHLWQLWSSPAPTVRSFLFL